MKKDKSKTIKSSNVVLPEQILEYGMLPDGHVCDVEDAYMKGLMTRPEVVEAKKKYRKKFKIDESEAFVNGCYRILNQYADGLIRIDEATRRLLKAASSFGLEQGGDI